MSDEPLIVISGATDLLVDADGPDPLVAFLADDLPVDLPDEPLDIEFEAIGLPGRDGANGDALPVQAVAAASMVAGTPVLISRTTGQLIAADAAFKPTAFVAGLLELDVIGGFVGSAATGRLALTDWTAVIGAPHLVPGLPYFLAIGGGLTATAPNSNCVTLVGTAVDATTLLIDPQPPIQL